MGHPTIFGLKYTHVVTWMPKQLASMAHFHSDKGSLEFGFWSRGSERKKEESLKPCWTLQPLVDCSWKWVPQKLQEPAVGGGFSHAMLLRPIFILFTLLTGIFVWHIYTIITCICRISPSQFILSSLAVVDRGHKSNFLKDTSKCCKWFLIDNTQQLILSDEGTPLIFEKLFKNFWLSRIICFVL